MRSKFRTRLFLSHLALIAVITLSIYVLLDRVGPLQGELRVSLLEIAGAALLVAAALSYVVAKSATKPLGEMTEAAMTLARGDFELELARGSSDEFGALSFALFTLSSQLKARIRDVTEERDRLSAMLAGMVEGVLVLSAEGRVIIANHSAEEILEAHVPLVGRTMAEAIRHPQARDAVEGALQLGKAAESEIEALGLHARSVILNVQPLPSSSGGGAVAVLHDVTGLRRLEAVRRDFVSNVSHELQTPVASIQSYAEALLDGTLDERDTTRRFIEVIYRNARRMGRLVKDLLKLSQLEARSPEQLVREPIDVNEVVAHVVATMLQQADHQAGTELATDLPDDLWAAGDPDGLAQMLLNLVENALKYGKPSGKVTVAGRSLEDWVELSVTDDGPGIESRHLPRLFERFYRVDAGRSRDQGGTGLGLAIVKHLAESMGGSVGVTSEPGRGSRFTVRLRATDSR